MKLHIFVIKKIPKVAYYHTSSAVISLDSALKNDNSYYLQVFLKQYQYIMKKVIRHIKDTHREKTPSNKTPVLTKSTNMGIWVIGTSNQLFTRGS